MDQENASVTDCLKAKHVYSLLTDRYRISRNIRVEWFLHNLNKSFPALPKKSLADFKNEIDIISFITSDQNEEQQQKQKDYAKFSISCDTKFTFFSRKYCFVFVLDMSTSVANVDIQHSTILTDELYGSLSKCLNNLVKPFYVPGSEFLFEPEIYITIVAYLPFYSLDVNNVIIHGCKLDIGRIERLLSQVREKIFQYIHLLSLNIKSEHFRDVFGHRVPGKIVIPANLSLINMIRFGLLSLNLLPENSHQGIVIVTDGNTSFSDAHTLESALAQLRLNMISCSFIHIGSPPHPDSALGYVPYIDFMNFIAQATFGAYLSISSDYDCDFEPNQFNIFHRALFVYSFNHGTCSFSKCLSKNKSKIWTIENPYFYSDLDDERIRFEKKDQQTLRRKQLESQINAGFAQILSYRLREGFTIKKVNFLQTENIIELALILPWRYNVNIEYHISAYFQPNGNMSDEEDFNFTSYEVIVESNYSFLHDASCLKKVFKSPLRATTIKQFCAALKHFSDSDNLGLHFHHFAKNEMYRSIPESLKKGVSLYYLPPSSNVPVVSVQNEAHLKFAQYWKPICMLDVNMCQKSSLHTHQINVLLKHDHPLPEFLYQPNSFGRYDTIQCKQTMLALNVVLKEWSSFVLLENHSYIKLIKEKENKSCSFYLIRIVAQPPCLVLHLAFIGGTSGSLRNQIVNELSQKLKQWKLPQRNLSSSLMQKSANASNHTKNDPTANEDDSYSNDLSNEDDTTDTEEDTDCAESESSKENDTDSTSENNPGNANTNVFITISSHNKRNSSNNTANCFVILNRPIERMLIRYDKIPKNFNSCYKYEEDWRNKNSLTSYASLNMFQTLVRFLHHQRSIWCTHDSTYSLGSSKLNISSLSKILSTITMKRIKEGFTIAYNECGVVNLVKELMMKDDQTDDEESKTFPCLVQYIIFPSNVLTRDITNDGALNDHWEEDEEDQVDASHHHNHNNNKNLFAENGCHNRHDGGKHLIVTECWVEPQNGRTSMMVNNNQNDDPQQSFDYDQISSSFYQRDLELVSVLLTYEYLVSYDPKYDSNNQHWRRKSPVVPKNRPNPEERKKSSPAIDSNLNLQSSRGERFKHIPFRFDLLNILDKSQQALIKFSTLNQIFDFNDCDETEDFSKLPAWHNCPNIMLYSEFVHKMCQLHDEIPFDHSQTISFIRKTNERLARHYSFEKEPLFTNVEDLEQDSSVVFRCFSKKFSDDCIILTLLPSTYQVVRKLTFVDYNGQKINQNLINKLEDRGQSVCYGSIIFPIIVHKLTFNSLTNILLNIHNPVEQLCPNWDLLFDYSDGSENFYSDQNDIIQTMETQIEEIALENFTKSIETLFRNSFTDAIYKSLRYGFHADDRDVELVLEKICNKKFGYVDITDFLVYTCKHMRPVIDSYFAKYPSNSIFDLLSFIADYVDNNEDGQQQQRDILTLTLRKQSNCCNSNSRLKANFVNLIQSHFSAIPTPSDSYYYYDYENIQIRRYFTFQDTKMVAQKNLVGFYEKIDNNEMDLTMFYEKIKNLSRLLDQDNIKMEHAPEEEVLAEETPTGNDDIPEPLVENGVNMSELQSLIMTKPFFVGFFYSLTLKNDTQARKISSIPTCLMEIISAEQENINLENFRVFLNIEIITQNIEPFKISSNDSNASHGGAADVQVISDDSTVFLEKLLDPFQVYKYREFFNHIQWMIRDEIVANSHDLFQICPQTLEMVVDHIKATGKSKTSFIDKVELKFVFPLDEDFPYLKEFQVELKQLRFSNFKLMEMGEYLYVVQDPDSDAPVVDSQNFENLLITEYSDEESVCHYSPNFWLILRFELDESKTNFVELYFHIRQKMYVFGSEILNHLKKCLELLCKKYNQQFLLAHLHENRFCDDLLIAKDDPDPFIKNTVRSTSNLTPISNFWEANSINSNFDLDYESFDNISLKISRANFTSGAFQCDIVWDKHFPLHRRLHSNSSKEGFNTIRSVLNSFIVSNRNNLYFYKEKSGAVFYMRIYEIECSNDTFGENFHPQSFQMDPVDFELYKLNFDNIILPMMINSTSVNNQDDDSKCDSDNDSVNSLNVNRSNFNVPQECILMNVHGIEEPSNEIKVDMVAALQKKLDEAVLDILILLFARNPHSKLTNQDVSFIQGHNSGLKNFHFVINESYYPYIQNIKGYIRQNLSTFLYNPKFAERNPETHFKLFKNNEFHCVKDEDVFLYYCTHESGKDTKGIACIIFSIVSQEKLFDMTPSTFNVNQTDINDFVNGYFDYIVSVSNTFSKENLNIKFCINFQVWHAGKIDLLDLNKKFRAAIAHSLWEFNLEFKILKLCTYEDGFNCNSISEPSTPKKIMDKRERRTGLANVGLKPSLLQIDDSKLFNKDYDKYGQASSSTFIETVGQEDYFDFGQIDLYHKQYIGNSSDQYTGINVREIRNKELICLSHFLKVAIKPWLDYGRQLSVPSIDRFEFPVVMKKSIFTIMKEFKDFIGKFSGDMKLHYLMASGQQYYEFDGNSEFAFNNDDNSYMILLRHENLWKAKFLHQSENSFTNNFIGKCDVNKFKFAPCFYNPNVKSIHDSNLALNTSNEFKLMEPDIIKCLSPRQKILLIFIEDGKLKLYLYNWTNSMNMSIVTWFSHMILWHNARSLLLHNLILQKAGLFHNNLFKRHTLEDLMTMSNTPQIITKNKFISSTLFLNIDLLLKYDNPYRAAGEIKDQPTPAANKMDFIFETKNYEYVFSDFVRNENHRNLFDCFNGQFNSNYNVYIRDLKELSKVWQLHGTKLNYPTKDMIIQHVKSYGRLSHYCLTPFLFSHKWRFAISLIRDHSLPMQVQRIRHMSGGNILKQSNNEHEFMISKQRSRRKSGPPNMLEHSLMIGNQRSASDETLDLAVCPHYIQEYVQYLQSLGFSSIKSQKVVSLKKNLDFERRYENHYGPPNYGKYKISASGTTPILVGGNRKTSQHSQKNEYEKFYLIKTVIGGFYLFEIGFSEPFVYSYLYSFDSKRFTSWIKNNSSTNVINFLDELDSIMVRMHLHSFTYDYHLRVIHSYISGRQMFQRGYHLISFLDDFIRYYQKAPNYSRNHVYSDNLIYESEKIIADQLYNYLIKHNQNYGINVFPMSSTFSLDQMSEMNEEYVLILLSSNKILFIDENNIQQEDNFDVTLLVAYQKSNNARILRPKELCLKFYLLLTSQRELFPKLYSFGDKGLFRTIRMLSNPNVNSINNFSDNNGDDDQLTTKSIMHRNSYEENPNSIMDRSNPMGISDEKINYLGYFNAHEIVMLNILEQKVNETRQNLENIIKAAEIDCRRDHIWENLIGNEIQITMEDLNELLSLVKSIRLEEYDETLSQFNSFNLNWYRSLAQKLELKFEYMSKKIYKNGSLKMALFKSDCKDCFIMFHLKNSPPCLVEFKIVFKKPSSAKIDQAFLRKCNPRYHELVEEFVNTLTAHMWTAMSSNM